MVALISVLCYLSLFLSQICADVCPQLGTKSVELFPGLLIPNGDQKVGHHALIESFLETKQNGIRSAQRLGLIDDSFDGLTGVLKFNSINTLHYYLETNEGYFVTRESQCYMFPLSFQMDIVNLWSLAYHSLKSFNTVTVFNITGSLGPVGILRYSIEHKDDLQLINSDVERTTNEQGSRRWFICLPGAKQSLYIEIGASRHISQVVLQLDEFTNLIFNFIKFTSFDPDLITPVAYPHGYGCKRGLDSGKPTPRFAETIVIDSQITLFFNQTYSEKRKSLSLLKYDGIYSYDIDSKLRIIYDPKSSTNHVLNLATGGCSINSLSSLLAWPFASNYYIDLSKIFQLDEENLSYLGQVKCDPGLCDIYETVSKKFLMSKNKLIRATITYFISNEWSRVPSKIEIRLENEISESKSLTKMEVEIVNFREGNDLVNFEKFDTQSCYSEFGHFTWFQIIFSEVSQRILSMKNRKEILEIELRKATDFIPVTRLSDIQIGNYGPSIYITSKLLDGPSILSAYDHQSPSILTSPNFIMKRDNDIGCAESCWTINKCKAFSYCSDQRCFLYNESLSSDNIPNQKNNQCNFYLMKAQIEDSKFQFTSSSTILNQLKLMIDNRKLVLPRTGLIAHELFIVSNPLELGGYGDSYEYDNSETSKLREYNVILSEYKISSNGNKKTGLRYIDCLYRCENDDNCLTVSYCTDGDGECTISSSRADIIMKDVVTHTSYGRTCKIMSKNFLDFFNRFPGRSLNINNGLRQFTNLDREACAKACFDENEFVCEAFDHCLDKYDPNSFVCFLHKFHIFNNSSHKNITTKWDFTSKQCDHFSRKLSLDYKQLVGMKLREVPVIATINDNSLENCASACYYQAEEECLSFEYCDSSDSIPNKSSCRLSSVQIVGQIDNLEKFAFCSVYGRDKDRNTKYLYLERGPSVVWTTACGLTAFLSGVTTSAIITFYLLRKKSRS